MERFSYSDGWCCGNRSCGRTQNAHVIGDVDSIIEVEEVLVNVDVRPNDAEVEVGDDMVVVRPEVL